MTEYAIQGGKRAEIQSKNYYHYRVKKIRGSETIVKAIFLEICIS
jgi:hypothetical protein